MKVKHSVLVTSDTGFKAAVKDFQKYIEKLNDFLIKKNEEKDIQLSSVKGKYCFDDTLALIDIDDKNKTSFVKSIGDYLNKFDEVVIITNYFHEPFLESLRTQLKEENKATTVFSYEVRPTTDDSEQA